MVELLHEKEDLSLGENKKTNIFCQVCLSSYLIVSASFEITVLVHICVYRLLWHLQ